MKTIIDGKVYKLVEYVHDDTPVYKRHNFFEDPQCLKCAFLGNWQVNHLHICAKNVICSEYSKDGKRYYFTNEDSQD